MKQIDDPLISRLNFENWNELLSYLDDYIAKNDQKIVLFLDEYKEISPTVIAEVEEKLSLLHVRSGITIEKALVSQYGADKKLKASEYFHHDLNVRKRLA